MDSTGTKSSQSVLGRPSQSVLGRPSQIVLGAFSAEHERLLTESPEILRGVSRKTVLRNAAYWLRTGVVCKDEATGAETARIMYAKSAPAKHFKEFMSHSWHAPAWKKCIGILCMYNGQAATIGGLTCSLCVACLRWSKLLPAWNPTAMSTFHSVLIGSPQPSVGMSGWCLMGFMFGYGIFFIFWQEIREAIVRVVGRRPDVMFFDKLSIHQHDEALQKQGIRAISYYLFHSERMTIVWDRTYFSRMWCVFEMAIYLKVHGIEKIQFAPLFFYVAEFVFICAVCVPLLGFLVLMSFNIPQQIVALAGSESVHVHGLALLCAIASSFPMPLISFAFKHHVIALADRASQLQAFAIENARCFDETDRKYVTDIVVRLYGSAEAFNAYIQGEVADTLAQRDPHDISSMISYWMLVRMGAPFMVIWGLDAFAVAEGVSFYVACHGLRGAVVFSFGVFPITISFMVALHCLRLRPGSKFEEYTVKVFLTLLLPLIPAAAVYAMVPLFSESLVVWMPTTLAVVLLNVALRARQTMLPSRRRSFSSATPEFSPSV